MPIRSLVVGFVVVVFSSSLHAQSGQTGKPVIANVDNNQPTLAPAADLTVVENKLGIGTATPAFKLDVVGQINGSGGLCMGGDCRTTWPGAGTSGPWTLSGTSVLYGGGNVGIGSSSPAHKLDVAGQMNASGGLCISGDCRTSWPSAGGWTTSGSNTSYSGNVGIGTTTPGSSLDILTDSSLRVRRSSHAASLDFYIQGPVSRMVTADATSLSIGHPSNVNRFVMDASGNVGLGTTSPSTALDVAGYLTIRSGSRLRLPTPNFGNYAEIYSPTSEGAGAAPLAFNVGGGEAVRITNVMNVGIGTTSPAQKLHVVGNVRVDGNISALYQDVAEWVEAIAPLADGTVVVLDPSRPNVVSEATTAYDTRVAGAVSGQPGVLLGEAAANKELIAQSGRVRFKVDASFGPIAIGDLLVTSPTAGHAMRSTPVEIGGVQLHRPGTLLGKALESLASGRGEILVLLTLQ